MPENNIHILCTRQIEQLLISKAAAKNITIDTTVFIRTEALGDNKLAEQVNHLSQQKIVVIFTSTQAVEAISKFSGDQPDWKIFCIGGATKDLAKKNWGEKIIESSARNAHALSEKIIATKKVKEVYFFCGDQRLNDLPETLRANDIFVHEIICYATIQTPQYIEENYDGIMFFSPSAVHSFFSVNTVATNVVLFSIGKTTSAIIHSYCMNKVITSEWPGAENLTEAVMNYFDTI